MHPVRDRLDLRVVAALVAEDLPGGQRPVMTKSNTYEELTAMLASATGSQTGTRLREIVPYPSPATAIS
jgi:hypothetical protein